MSDENKVCREVEGLYTSLILEDEFSRGYRGQPGLFFHEYEFDSLKPGERWTGPLLDRIIKSVN